MKRLNTELMSDVRLSSLSVIHLHKHRKSNLMRSFLSLWENERKTEDKSQLYKVIWAVIFYIASRLVLGDGDMYALTIFLK